MNSISFSYPTRQLFIFSMLIFTIGSTWGQNNPYQAECSKFDNKPSFQCLAYSNCRMMGGSSDLCQTSSGGNKIFNQESEDEIKARKILEQEMRDKPQKDLQQYQQELKQQYQKNKK